LDELIYEWNEEKNILLSKERDVSFEDVIFALKNDKILDIILSPTHEGQKCFIVEIKAYAYVIPYVRVNATTLFLKTIYPSRKHTKILLKGKL
jgi:sporulation protein YlmC with PRC-barrel domain